MVLKKTYSILTVAPDVTCTKPGVIKVLVFERHKGRNMDTHSWHQIYKVVCSFVFIKPNQTKT